MKYDLPITQIEEVEESYHNGEWQPDREQVDNMLEEILDWLVLTKDRGKPVYNSEKIRITDISYEEQQLELELGRTDYYSHVSTRDLGALDSARRPNTLGIGAIVQTKDGSIVLGEKSRENEIGSGQYTMPSGLAEFDQTESLEEQAYRELVEETGMKSKTMNLEPSILFESMNHLHLIYTGKVDLELDEIVSGWRETKNSELSSILGLRSDESQLIDHRISGKKKLIRNELELRPHTEKALKLLETSE